MRPLIFLVFSLVPLGGFAATDTALMPEALETELALSAAPPHLRAEATVMLLRKEGYVKAREGSNGFTCLVSRPRPKAVAPMCYDVEGSKTIVPRMLDEAAMRARGESAETIRKAVEEGFRTGTYQTPSRPGIAYMISPVQDTVSSDGVISPYVPHLMFYAPNLTDADIGGTRGGAVFINSPAPHGMIIVPLGKDEQEKIRAEHEALEKKVRAFLESSPQEK